MNFLAPLAFALAALLPIIIALYFLKLRRMEQRISSTYLWRTLVRDTAANAPWQRLRPNMLMFLQLLFLAALIIALARPFTWSDTAAGSHLILVIDTSPSMNATDVKPSRLAEAVAIARRMIDSLPSSSRATLITAGAQSPIFNLQSSISAISSADLPSALTIASAIAAREPDSEIVILSDGHVALQPVTLPSRARFVSIGNSNHNQAIGAFSAQREAGGRHLTAFAQLVNYGAQAVSRRLVLYADGRVWTARDVMLASNQAQAVTFAGLPLDAHIFEAHLEGDDMLALDDRAYVVPPSNQKISVRVVTTGNRFLETALRLMPNVVIAFQSPISYTQSPTANFHLTIFDSFVPTTTLPMGNLLLIAPLRATELFSVTGSVEAPVPVPVVGDDPILRYVDLRDVTIQAATRVPLPSWARAVIMDSKSSAPLLMMGEQGNRHLGILAFDLRHSDLPLRVAFPLLMANLLDALASGSVTNVPTSVEVGHAFAILAPAQATAAIVRAPNGQTQRLTPQEGRVVFDQTHQLGVYELMWEGRDVAAQRLYVVVNLFNPDESDITPRETLPIVGAGNVSGQALPRAREEWWRPLAWLALALLVAEWLWAYRGNLVQVVEWGKTLWQQHSAIRKL
jgi:hypothetical protein